MMQRRGWGDGWDKKGADSEMRWKGGEGQVAIVGREEEKGQ